ncbi:RHS repeat domain-containing protein [Enterobacter ludwigii]|uniref:RHS repeat domain-containing protein n=1 Tax=Enterobacter ludwigii TaxID=299767 RepID=UPI002B4BF6C9|nr:RHS repeat domain-containing protein [Enterobacter ludwigii]WRM04083.1 RHS repeat domain-containing protein [Enterobacter ludwigii]
MTPSLFSNTPSVTVLDNRDLTVRDIAYHRHPDSPDFTDERITRLQYHARGFLTQSADPRLHDAGLANFSYQTDLAGRFLRTQGADNGLSLHLNDAAGRPLIAVSNVRTPEDAAPDCREAVTRTWQYEDAELPGRPVSITEQVTGNVARVTERFVYAGNSVAEKALNLAGVCVSHYDTAGLVQTDSVALTGVPQSVTRLLLRDADNPDTVADWRGADASAWNNLLAGEREGQTTLTVADATGAVQSTTDAEGNRQRVAYDVAGMLSGSWLTVKDGTERVIVASLTYSAAGQKLREAHGNGVVTTYTYNPQTQRMTGIKTERPAGHVSGAKVLQDLRYAYDPVGNVLKVSNDAEETRFWRNQKVVPENTYVYDSLYQLVSATGREMAGAGQQGSHLPSAMFPFPADSAAYTNYTRTYTYDSGGNLTQIRHSAPATGYSYATNITISDRSNRGVLSSLTANPAEVDALFTAGGQQTQLLPGQLLVWTARNELLTVTPVVREGIPDDQESYRYDSNSQRVLKVSVQRAGNSTRTQRVVYLPGLELRTTKAGDTETEGLQVITVGEAGRAQVRVLHWTSGRPEGISHDPIRYSYDNLTGSSQLELDSDGNVISMEEYYPYGGTAILTARSQTEVSYKTVRYSGKERDVTGLYYYGYRYYQPWAGRWLSADPAGTVDGLNLFRMVRNNPVTLYDTDGCAPGQINIHDEAASQGETVIGAGLTEIVRKNQPFAARIAAAYTIAKNSIGFARERVEQMRETFSEPASRQVANELFNAPVNNNNMTVENMDNVLSKIKKLDDFFNTYSTENIVGVTSSDTDEARRNAWVNVDDPKQHLFIKDSSDYESTSGFVWDIIHEISHLAIKTDDMWYIQPPFSDPDHYEKNIKLRVFGQHLMLKSGERQGILWYGPGINDVDKDQFMDNQSYRVDTIMNNADSIALLIANINYRYGGPSSINNLAR